MNMKKRSFAHPSALLTALLSSVALFSPLHAGAASLTISQVPLYLGGTVEPNIMFILDDSGSMAWSYMPDDRKNSDDEPEGRSSTYNSAYYNPNVKYLPPLDQDGNSLPNATFTNAWMDGYKAWRGASTIKTDLSKDFRPTWYYEGYSDEWAHNDKRAAYYYEYRASNSGCDGSLTDDDCYTYRKVETTPGPDGLSQTTNFANWYAYYRTRMMAAKAGVSRAFAQQGTGMRVGYGRINKSSGTADGVSSSTIERGVRDFSDKDVLGNTTNNRKEFFNWLFDQQPSGSTPLRRALDAAGQYYQRTDDKGPASTTPGSSGGKDLSCRQNFSILTTDGYWSEGSSYDAATSAAKENQDGSNGPLISGPNSQTGQFLAVPPYSDAWSNTLADVAAYYYKRDLRTDLTNNVPTNPDDPAFWQHMVTFGVGLGVVGSITPADAFAAIGTGANPNWPNPTSGNSQKIDDLLHAAVNSRGEFFSAADPNAFSNALSDTLATINARTSSAATVASNTARLSTDTLLFQASFNSGDWSGDMLAFEIDQRVENPPGTPNPNYGNPKSTPKWKASEQIPSPTARKLFTSTGGAGTGIDFTWTALTSAQKTALNNNANLLSWLRGDQSQEVKNGGTYRTRDSLMGDVVNSDPVAVGREDYNYALASSLTDAERTAYATRRASTAFKNRKSALFFGANDGIFRGINSETGQELFGYIPNTILSGLPTLAEPKYNHRYYVDGSPRAADALIGSNWKTVLVSSTGAGGRSYFALDVENASSFSTSNVMWEISNTTSGFSELGVAIGQASIVRTESGHWVAIIGNGYNSTSQTARLFVVNLSTGALLKEINTGIGNTTTPNGLATPIAIDSNRNGSIDLVYAGDLHGNMWKFDFTGTSVSDWKVAFAGKPLFKATNSNGVSQPITSKPQVGAHPDGGLMVYFGTGKYFETGDSTDIAIQSLYGVRDECALSTSGCTASAAAKVLRSNLLQQTITYEGMQTFSGNAWEIRQFSQNSATSNHRGFYVDLLYSNNAKGERILATPLLWSDRVIFVSAIPDSDVCAGGGASWIIELDPKTGGRTYHSVFDLARDGTYGASNEYNSKAVNARKVIGGMIKNLGQIRDSGGKSHKYGATSTGTIDRSTQQNDGSRRISWRQIQ